MPTTTQTNPDPIPAYARLLRLTDRLLEVAEELREARDKLQSLVDRHQAKRVDERKTESCK